jgi:hypothetical protein
LAGSHDGNLNHDHAVGNGLRLDWDDVKTGDEGSVEGTRWHGLWLKVDESTRGSGEAADKSEGWVRLDWESDVGRWAGLDEA